MITRIEAVVPERTKCAELTSLARVRRRTPGISIGTFSTDDSLSDWGITNYQAVSLPIETAQEAFAPQVQRLNSEPEPDRAPLPEQQNGPMLARAAPGATLLIADSLSPGHSAPSRPPSFAPSCREIRRPKIRSRSACLDPSLERIPPCAWYFVPLFRDLRQRQRNHADP